MEKLMTAMEVADLLNVSRGTVYNLANKGELPSVRASNRRMRFSKREVEEYIRDGGMNGHQFEIVPARVVTDERSGERKALQELIIAIDLLAEVSKRARKVLDEG